MDLTHVRFEGTQAAARPAALPSCGDECRRPVAPAAAERPVEGLPAFVLRENGLLPSAYREPPLRRRTAACLRSIREVQETAAIDRLRGQPRLAAAALSTLLIGVSEWFRDPAVFAAVEAGVVPDLRARRRIRVLSVGCSSGAELYSVAVLLAEAGLLDRAELVGVDCRADAVTAACAGLFPDAALANVSAARRAAYLEHGTGGWQVVDGLRQATRWHVLDATRSCPAGPWDLVLCRNLVIYLHAGAAEAMMTRLVDQLAPRGSIVVGKAERPPARLGLVEIGRCVYHRHDA